MKCIPVICRHMQKYFILAMEIHQWRMLSGFPKWFPKNFLRGISSQVYWDRLGYVAIYLCNAVMWSSKCPKIVSVSLNLTWCVRSVWSLVVSELWTYRLINDQDKRKIFMECLENFGAQHRAAWCSEISVTFRFSFEM